MPRWFRFPYFRAGLIVRIVAAPFLLQWFHPDERQFFEFAHSHATGRIQPFLESELHLRNQTLPWLFSWAISFLDRIGLHSPYWHLLWAHWLIALASWFALTWTIETSRVGIPQAQQAPLNAVAWLFALFWVFPLLYSRALLEALSLIPTLLLWASIRRGRWGWAGFFGGMAAIFRYPSALWSVGAGLLLVARVLRDRKYATDQPKSDQIAGTGVVHAVSKAALSFLVAFAFAVFLGGLADWHFYGKFLESAGSYWAFNHPHGPVEGMFGNDSVWVYWRWFEFALSPVFALPFLVLAVWALIRSPQWIFFIGPYLIGHLWTPHREPRFMLPVFPFLLLAIAETASLKAKRPIQFPPRCRSVFHALLGLNLLWLALHLLAQTQSAQGALLLNWDELAREPTWIINLGDPLIDDFVPLNSDWSESDCRWHRTPSEPALRMAHSPSERGLRLWVLSEANPSQKDCRPISRRISESETATLWTRRLFRVREGALFDCKSTVISNVCPKGVMKGDGFSVFHDSE